MKTLLKSASSDRQVNSIIHTNVPTASLIPEELPKAYSFSKSPKLIIPGQFYRLKSVSKKKTK